MCDQGLANKAPIPLMSPPNAVTDQSKTVMDKRAMKVRSFYLPGKYSSMRRRWPLSEGEKGMVVERPYIHTYHN